ncbi:hypothetical protein RchiOBHm_Chr2g0143251 [Rosa chinensis]|uniref:Uncharacterized protein n=1 Tax=Rosa chinensis TaxID=74649 RepID=A0A2P6RY31_ROSCH|nr:hypothetical protein RchiOBHm_Chr2g0143251 [Rosa chinensis]
MPRNRLRFPHTPETSSYFARFYVILVLGCTEVVGLGAEQGIMGNKMLTLDEYVINVTSWKFGTPLVTFIMFLYMLHFVVSKSVLYFKDILGGLPQD